MQIFKNDFEDFKNQILEKIDNGEIANSYDFKEEVWIFFNKINFFTENSIELFEKLTEAVAETKVKYPRKRKLISCYYDEENRIRPIKSKNYIILPNYFFMLSEFIKFEEKWIYKNFENLSRIVGV